MTTMLQRLFALKPKKNEGTWRTGTEKEGPGLGLSRESRERWTLGLPNT